MKCLQRLTMIKIAKREMGGTNLVSPKIVSTLIAGFAVMFPPKSDSKADKAAAKELLTKHIRENEAVKQALVTLALAQAASTPDEDEDDDETDGE